MGYPVTHFQIDAVDDKASAEFYAQLFDWKLEAVPAMAYHSIATGSKEGIQGGVAKVEAGKSGVTFYVEVPDVAAALQKAESLGAKILMPMTQAMPDLILGIFVDLEGRTVGLSTNTRPKPVEPKPEPAIKKLKIKAKAAKKDKAGKKVKKAKKDKKGKKKRK